MTTGRLFLVVLLLWRGLAPAARAAAPGPPPVAALQRQLAAAPPDTSRVLLLNSLCWQLATQNTVQALTYGQQGLHLARQLSFRLGEVYLLNSLARVAYLQHDELAAIGYYQQAVRRAEATPRAARQLTLALVGLGRVAVGQQDFAEGEKYFRLALSRMQQRQHAVQPTDLGMVHNCLASLYFSWRRSGQPAPDSLQHLLTRHVRQEVAVFRRLPPDEKLAACLNDLGEVHALAGRYDSAARCQREAIALCQRFGNQFGLAQARLSLASVYLARQRPAEAARLLRPALAAARRLHAAGLAAESYQLLAQAQAAQGQGLEAYRLACTGQALLDSVQSAERRQALVRLQVQFDAERQRNQLKELTQRNLLQQAEAHRQRQYLWLAGGLLLAVAAGLLASGALAWRLRRSQAQLTLQNEELTATRAEQDRLYALVAHDLRSPVVAFSGLADLMTRYIERHDMARLAGLGGRVRQAAEGLRSLLDNLLSWALTQRGELVAHPEPLAVAALLAEAAALYQPSAEAADVHLRVETAAAPADSHVLADHNMTSTILRNLLSNALQATPPGGQIVLAAGAATAGYLSLEVRDTGAGMAAAQLRHAQGLTPAGALAPGRRGPTGLGLRLSRAFAQAQRGQLALSSQPGQGTTAALRLPVAPAPVGVFLPAAALAAV
jgi:signal transduction histidine kinase